MFLLFPQSWKNCIWVSFIKQTAVIYTLMDEVLKRSWNIKGGEILFFSANKPAAIYFTEENILAFLPPPLFFGQLFFQLVLNSSTTCNGHAFETLCAGLPVPRWWLEISEINSLVEKNGMTWCPTEAPPFPKPCCSQVQSPPPEFPGISQFVPLLVGMYSSTYLLKSCIPLLRSKPKEDGGTYFWINMYWTVLYLFSQCGPGVWETVVSCLIGASPRIKSQVLQYVSEEHRCWLERSLLAHPLPSMD